MSRQKVREQMLAQQNLHKENSSAGRYLNLGLAFFCFLFLGVVLFLTVDADIQTSPGKVVTKENYADMLEQLSASDAEDDTSYEVVMTSSWTFATGDAASKDAYVENSSRNRNTVYFSVNLLDDELPLYVSPQLSVGSHIGNIKLDTPLDAGAYDAVLTYYLLDGDGNCVSKIPMKLKITVNQ